MERNKAWELVKKQVKNKNLRKHMLATEAVMRALARRFGEDEEAWGLAGLLHDLDYDETKDDFERHGFRTAELLTGELDSEEILYAIKAHPGHVERKTRMDKALYAVDPLTGLIVAATLMHPEKKLKSVESDFIMRRFAEKRFAAGANREQIGSCTGLDLELDEFITIALKAMQTIDRDLGL